MIRAFSLRGDALTLEPPPISGDLSGGLVIEFWAYRNGTEPGQRLLELVAPDGGRWLLECGPDAASLSNLVLSQQRGDTRAILTARGALPQDRWVKLTLTLGPSEARLAAFDVTVGSAAATAPSGAQRLLLCPSASRRFRGALSDLRIYTNALRRDGDLWARYVLDGAVFLRTETLRMGTITRSYYNILDSGPAGRHITTTSAPVVATFEDALGAAAPPALRLPGNGKGLQLSPVSGLSSGFTVEAWVRPVGQTQALLSVAFGFFVVSLALGDDGSVVVRAAGQGAWSRVNQKIVLARGFFPKDRFCHLAVSLAVKGTVLSVAAYQQGQLRERTSVNLYLPGAQLFGSLARSINLGGAAQGLAGFSGAVAELRLFSGALGDDEIGARWLTRLSGDEPRLLCCYRLDEAKNGCTRDLSPRLGLCTLPDGTVIEATPGLPLPSTISGDGVRIIWSGKLVRETVLRPGPTMTITTVGITEAVGVVPTLPRPGIGTQLPKGPVRANISLYDATIEARAPSGQPFSGQALEVRVDRAATALITDELGVTRDVDWSPGQSYSVPIPAGGTARLRLRADELSCPTLRVRVAGMAGGLWAVIRPDAVVHDSLRGLSAADLRRPADGRPSPLPESTDDDDANALAAALTGLGRALPPVPPPRRYGEQRGFFEVLSDVGDVINDGVDAVGDLGDAIVDVSQDALQQAKRVAKTAKQLVVRGADEVNALVQKARQTPARLGLDAIRGYIDAADSLVVAATTGGDLLHSIEIVGTMLLKEGKGVWRVVVSGIGEALAAMQAIIKRVGAELKKIIDYLAYLFRWGDFLKAADTAYAYLEQTIGQIPKYIGDLDKQKDKLKETLAQTFDASLMSRSVAQLTGVDLDPDTPGVAEMDYVIEQFQKVLDLADLAASGGGVVAAVAGAEVADSLQRSAEAGLAGLGLERFENPVALLTTPLGQLLSPASSTAKGSGDVVDDAFQRLKGGAQAAVDGALDLVKARLYVPGLTPLLEETILGGKTLCVLRITALLAGIAMVLTDKLARSVRGGTGSPKVQGALFQRATVNKASTRSAATATPSDAPSGSQQLKLTPAQIWTPTCCELIANVLLALQAALEIAGVRVLGDDSPAGKEQREKLEARLGKIGAAAALFSALKGIADAAMALNQPGPTAKYAAIVAAQEVAMSLYLVLSNGARGSGSSHVKYYRVADPVILTLLGLGIIGVRATPLGLHEIRGTQSLVSYSLGTAAMSMSVVTRFMSAFDNLFAKAKYFTAGLALMTDAVELTGAIYDHTTSLPST